MHIKKQNQLSAAARFTLGALLLAFAGVVVQKVSGHPYSTVPLVFFILLVPADLLAIIGGWIALSQMRRSAKTITAMH